jgi:hypothetical protein
MKWYPISLTLGMIHSNWGWNRAKRTKLGPKDSLTFWITQLSFKASQLHLRKANTTLLKKKFCPLHQQQIQASCNLSKKNLLIKHERRHEICLLFFPCRGHLLSVVLSFLLIVDFWDCGFWSRKHPKWFIKQLIELKLRFFFFNSRWSDWTKNMLHHLKSRESLECKCWH